MTDSTEREGLKPCPLCAGEVDMTPSRSYLDEWDGSVVRPSIYCRPCGLTLAGQIYVDIVNQWNRRPTEAAKGAG